MLDSFSGSLRIHKGLLLDVNTLETIKKDRIQFKATPMSIVMHLIGRLTAPIMWFFVCEGYHYTKDSKKYIMRLGIFAAISHFAYCFSFGIPLIPFSTGIFNQTSVMYPLFIAALVLWIEDNSWLQTRIWLKRIITFILIWSAFPADWSCIAVLAIIGMYKKRGDLKRPNEKDVAVSLLVWCCCVFLCKQSLCNGANWRFTCLSSFEII